jgi:hypothetical protein
MGIETPKSWRTPLAAPYTPIPQVVPREQGDFYLEYLYPRSSSHSYRKILRVCSCTRQRHAEVPGGAHEQVVQRGTRVLHHSSLKVKARRRTRIRCPPESPPPAV